MDIQDVLKLADSLVFNHMGKHLDDLQKTIIEGVCLGEKYADIAEKIPCSEGYVRDKASDLWKVLSNLSGEEINKSNFCSALERLQFSISSSFGLANLVGVTNNLSLCSDRLPSSEDKTNGKKRNKSANKKSENHITTLPNKNIREAPELGKIYGRIKEISTLENWILQENSRLIGILEISGIGKTTLSRHLLEKVQDNFDYIIWKNLYHAPSLSKLTAQLVLSLSNQIYINFSLSETTEKNSLLDLELETLLSIFYEYLRNYRCLIILDNLQAILAENKFSGNYQNQFQNYSQFFQNIGELPHHSCLIFNSWESPLEIINMTGLKTPVRIMSLNGIGETAREIFKEQNLSDEETWQKLIDTYRGNPYYLKTVCRMIQEIFNGKVRDYLAYNSLFLGDEIIAKLDRNFQRLSLLEKQVISQLSQIDKPVTVTEILEKLPLSPPQVLQTIQSLGRRSLIEKITQEKLTLFTVSPVIREYGKILDKIHN
ncbi:MAG: ATPase [Okeania sp. SIO3I5]|uniref:NB-ARC domain-containing protein n=1 Tax=Okeania sp. SIO3I5 TaxID=2607805 RepID=UPI0013B87390|nr:NB-ARC domain-containing protein [Okeania sp. SIO3I5]NEQ40930.1 ATPase [Okeania sp. SIO3I5]